MGNGNEIGRIGRREGPVDLRSEPTSTAPVNTGIVPPGRVDAPEGPPAKLPELQDGYVPEPLTDVAAPLHGEGAPVTKGVWDIVPDLARMTELGQIPQRFAADIVLLRAQLSVPGIPLPEQADRLFQFFVAYAERFVEVANAVEADAGAMNQGDPGAEDGFGRRGAGGEPRGRASGELDLTGATSLWGEAMTLTPTEPAPGGRIYTPEEKAAEIRHFTQVLRESGFSEFTDRATGKDGARAAAELLAAKSPAEVEQRAREVQFRSAHAPATQTASVTRELPAAMARAPDAAPSPDAARATAAASSLRAEGAGLRVQPFALPAAPIASPAELRTDPPDEAFLHRMEGTSKRLGPRMLWNVLHTFRGDGVDGAVFKDKWDKLTFGAILLLVGVALAVIALVSL